MNLLGGLGGEKARKRVPRRSFLSGRRNRADFFCLPLCCDLVGRRLQQLSTVSRVSPKAEEYLFLYVSVYARRSSRLACKFNIRAVARGHRRFDFVAGNEPPKPVDFAPRSKSKTKSCLKLIRASRPLSSLGCINSNLRRFNIHPRTLR